MQQGRPGESVPADGVSNRVIADQLALSVRTVDTHVEHILTRLGFISRTQIASWVTSRRTG